MEICENAVQKVSVHNGVCSCTSDCIQNRNGENIVFRNGERVEAELQRAVTMFYTEDVQLKRMLPI